MFEPLIALALFGSVVWVIAQAIFMLMRGNGGSNAEVDYQQRDTLADFIEENYASHFAAGDAPGEDCLRKL